MHKPKPTTLMVLSDSLPALPLWWWYLYNCTSSTSLLGMTEPKWQALVIPSLLLGMIYCLANKSIIPTLYPQWQNSIQLGSNAIQRWAQSRSAAQRCINSRNCKWKLEWKHHNTITLRGTFWLILFLHYSSQTLAKLKSRKNAYNSEKFKCGSRKHE